MILITDIRSSNMSIKDILCIIEFIYKNIRNTIYIYSIRDLKIFNTKYLFLYQFLY